MKRFLILTVGLIFIVGCGQQGCPNLYKKEGNKCVKYEYTPYENEYQCESGYTLYGTACTKGDSTDQETKLAKKIKVCPQGYEPVDGLILKRCKKVIDETPLK